MTINTHGWIDAGDGSASMVQVMSREVSFWMPTSTPSVPNAREHWGHRAKRTRKQRSDAEKLFRAFTSKTFAVELLLNGGTVRLTRVERQRVDDDNLRGALKAIRDGIADGIGVDDGDPRIAWEYAQETLPSPGVWIRITLRESRQ